MNGILRHIAPVDTSDKFAPANDLADKAFYLCQIHLGVIPIGSNRSIDHRKRIQNFGVQREGKPGVIEGPVTIALRGHGILIGTKIRQTHLTEKLQQGVSLFPVNRPR